MPSGRTREEDVVIDEEKAGRSEGDDYEQEEIRIKNTASSAGPIKSEKPPVEKVEEPPATEAEPPAEPEETTEAKAPEKAARTSGPRIIGKIALDNLGQKPEVAKKAAEAEPEDEEAESAAPEAAEAQTASEETGEAETAAPAEPDPVIE